MFGASFWMWNHDKHFYFVSHIICKFGNMTETELFYLVCFVVVAVVAAVWGFLLTFFELYDLVKLEDFPNDNFSNEEKMPQTKQEKINISRREGGESEREMGKRGSERGGGGGGGKKRGEGGG